MCAVRELRRRETRSDRDAVPAARHGRWLGAPSTLSALSCLSRIAAARRASLGAPTTSPRRACAAPGAVLRARCTLGSRATGVRRGACWLTDSVCGGSGCQVSGLFALPLACASHLGMMRDAGCTAAGGWPLALQRHGRARRQSARQSVGGSVVSGSGLGSAPTVRCARPHGALPARHARCLTSDV